MPECGADLCEVADLLATLNETATECGLWAVWCGGFVAGLIAWRLFLLAASRKSIL
jgi:hypothetical protein